MVIVAAMLFACQVKSMLSFLRELGVRVVGNVVCCLCFLDAALSLWLRQSAAASKCEEVEHKATASVPFINFNLKCGLEIKSLTPSKERFLDFAVGQPFSFPLPCFSSPNRPLSSQLLTHTTFIHRNTPSTSIKQQE